MKNKFFLLFLVISNCLPLLAQEKTLGFSFSPQSAREGACFYKSIELIDARYDTALLGVVQKGFVKEFFTVVPDTPLAVQFSTMLTELGNTNCKDGHLLLLLRFFKFIQVSERSNQTSTCYIRMNLYAKNDDKYFYLNSLDTAVQVKTSNYRNSIQTLFDSTSNCVGSFISESTGLEPLRNHAFDHREILAIDSIEKREIPIYNTESYHDGIYLSYETFKTMTPDYEVRSVDTTDNQISMLRGRNKEGKVKSISIKDVYGVIYHNIIYLNGERGFTILEKEEDDFFAVTKAAVTYRNQGVHKMTGFILLGVPGLLSNPKASYKDFRMKLDHIDGMLIKLKELSSEEIKANRGK